ncbi:TetR/AcrR family transcriptional regulator [Sulfobacillus thermosulfidooxidans]|uniref:TetR/AcrR family transcriptional regulator n=1 Tax=Sulfobacillus thermosulfidooxidans TaxID=28034 RepID=UPI0006B407FE|nr:TetR/AcrR family transcriptional regulator [Sulfobacillus thermosulfidooxidans]
MKTDYSQDHDPKSRILAVALNLFDQYGYAGTSMEAIRIAAGFRTKSSLYAHFSSKERIASTLFDRILQEENHALAPYFRSETEATMDDVLNIIEHLMVWGLLHQAAYRFCFIQWHTEIPFAHEGHDAIERLVTWATFVLTRCQREGQRIRPLSAEFLVKACQGVINHMIVTSPQSLSYDEARRCAHHTRELCHAIIGT